MRGNLSGVWRRDRRAEVVLVRHRGLAFHQFTFTGREPEKATITVRDQALQVERGHVGKPSLEITADSDAWLRFLAGDETPMGAIERLHGPLNLYVAFGRCFPAVVSEDDL